MAKNPRKRVATPEHTTTTWKNEPGSERAERRNRWWRLPEPPPEARSRRFETWTKEEERLLRKHFTSHGSRYTAALLGRSIPSVQDRAQRLGVPGHENRRWSALEEKYLRKQYPRLSSPQIARTLKRTVQSVRGKIHMLGLGSYDPERWTTREVEY